jgi:hypothetical protein
LHYPRSAIGAPRTAARLAVEANAIQSIHIETLFLSSGGDQFVIPKALQIAESLIQHC